MSLTKAHSLPISERVSKQHWLHPILTENANRDVKLQSKPANTRSQIEDLIYEWSFHNQALREFNKYHMKLPQHIFNENLLCVLQMSSMTLQTPAKVLIHI